MIEPDIDFQPLRLSDLPRMHKWRNTSFVMRWYGGEPCSYEDIVARYAPRVRGETPTRGFLIRQGGEPIGYIQTYRIVDHPDYARHVAVEDGAAGLDLFIGEAGYIHRGLGALVIRQFLREVVFADPAIACCVIGPEANNRAAIRAYEKAGFQYLKTVRMPGEPQPEYLMWIEREEV
ncbi:MAG: GNAT family N-acetyltransferase [Blastocatellia bacterium]